MMPTQSTILQVDLDDALDASRPQPVNRSAVVIQSLNDFPDYQQALTEENSLVWRLIPPSLRQHLVIVKIDTQRVQIAYDQSKQSVLRAYLHACKTQLLSLGFMVLDDLQVDTDIMQTVLRSVLAKKQNFQAHALDGTDVQRFRGWVLAANAAGATDLHLRVLGGGRGEVLARIDGELEPLPETRGGVTDADVLQAMRCAFESMADRHSNSTATFSEKTNMSCMIDQMLDIPDLRLRFNSQRGLDGPKAVVRLLHENVHKNAMSFLDMGFEPSQVGILQQAQRSESGIVLLCGVTGSGKTTVAKTFIETHPKNNGLIRGVEDQHYPQAAFYQVADPIEYRLRGTHQIYVQRDLMTLSEAGQKDPYSAVMESLMRMDPDGIDCGEIRDILSARAAMNIAKTGHLGLGTLHVSGISGILNRLTDSALGLTREELTADNALSLLVYQALIPVLCPHCKLNGRAATAQLTQMQLAREAQHLSWLVQTLQTRFKAEPAALWFKNLQGCTQCRQRGTRGLTMVAEMMMPDDEWLDDARTGNDRRAWRQFRLRYSDRRLDSPNMQGKTVLEHALYKALQGLVDPRHLERFARSIDRYEVLT